MTVALKPVSFRKGVEHKPRLSPVYVPGRRSKRFWTEAEDAVIRKYYPKGGGAACVAHLPGRGIVAVYQRANTLKVKGTHAAKQPKKRREVPSDIDDQIRAAWPTLREKGATNAWADEIGIPRWWLTKRATALGLTKAWKKEPPWTAAELALMEKVPLHDLTKCARIFRDHGFARSATAICVKAKRLEISRRYHATFSATAVGKILGLDNKTTTKMCISGELKAVKRKTDRLPQQGGDPWSVTRADLRAFIIEHLDRVDIRKVEKFAFVDVLVNQKEPA